MKFRTKLMPGESLARAKHRMRSHIQRVALERGIPLGDIVYQVNRNVLTAAVVRRDRGAICGTLAGRSWHRQLGEPVCKPCRDAHSEYLARARVRDCGTLKGVQAHRGRREKICKQCQLALDDAKAVKLRHEQQRKLIDEWRKKSNDAEIQREDAPVLA